MTGFNQEHTFHEKTDTPRHVQTLSCLQIYSYDEWVMMKHTPISEVLLFARLPVTERARV
jgi:hypothetical protein